LGIANEEIVGDAEASTSGPGGARKPWDLIYEFLTTDER
jgi:hypothetical protein